MHCELAPKGPGADTCVQVGFQCCRAVLLTFYHNISIVCVVPVQLSVLIDSTSKTGFRHLNDVSFFFLSYLHTDKFTKITKSIFLTWQGITVGCAFSA